MSRKIIGVTVGTQLPKPNFNQTDPTKGDYIKNKPDFDGLKSKVEQIEVRVDTMQENAYDDTELRGIVSENVAKIDTLNELVGNTKVETQIGDAVATLESEIDDKLGAMQSVIDSKVDAVDGMGLSTNDYTDADKDKLASIEANANFYEHPVHTSHDLGLYKITVDEEGHVSGATIVEKEDVVALGIPAQDTVYDDTGLKNRIDDLEDGLRNTNEELEGISQEFESYKTDNDNAVSENATQIEANREAIDGIKKDYLTSVDKTQLQDDINEVLKKSEENASAIEILNGEGDGSVKKSIDNAFNEFAANVTNDDVVNTYKELIDYAAKHGPEFVELVGEVDVIGDDVEKIKSDFSDYQTSVSDQFTEVDSKIGLHIDNTGNPHGVTKEHIGLENVDNTSDLEKPISYATQAALDEKSDVGHAHSDLYYDKEEIEELVTVDDIDAICGMESGDGFDVVSYATEEWVRGNYQQKGNYATESFVMNKIAEAELDGSGNEIDLSGYATKDDIPTKTSQLTNDSGYLTKHQSLADYATINSVNNKVATHNMASDAHSDIRQLIGTNHNESIIGLSVDGQTVTYIKGDGSVHSFTTQDTNTTYSIGTDEVTGLTKLYATTGNAEDGTMTQKAIKTELDKKVGVTIDAAQEMLIFTI